MLVSCRENENDLFLPRTIPRGACDSPAPSGSVIPKGVLPYGGILKGTICRIILTGSASERAVLAVRSHGRFIQTSSLNSRAPGQRSLRYNLCAFFFRVLDLGTYSRPMNFRGPFHLLVLGRVRHLCWARLGVVQCRCVWNSDPATATFMQNCLRRLSLPVPCFRLFKSKHFR